MRTPVKLRTLIAEEVTEVKDSGQVKVMMAHLEDDSETCCVRMSSQWQPEYGQEWT